MPLKKNISKDQQINLVWPYFYFKQTSFVYLLNKENTPPMRWHAHIISHIHHGIFTQQRKHKHPCLSTYFISNRHHLYICWIKKTTTLMHEHIFLFQTFIIVYLLNKENTNTHAWASLKIFSGGNFDIYYQYILKVLL